VTKLRDLSSRPPLPPGQRRLQEAAMEYVMHGWGIVPTSVCDGLRYTKGHTREVVPGFEPALPSGRTVTNARAAHSWYALAPYGIAARAGEDFDVLRAPTWLAVLATGRPQFRQHLCPVALAPSGVSILLRPGAELRDDLTAVRGVEIAPLGTLIPLPPNRVIGGLVTWWIRPQQVNWRLGDPNLVQDAIIAVLEESGAGDKRA